MAIGSPGDGRHVYNAQQPQQSLGPRLAKCVHAVPQAREIELHEAYAKLTAGAMERGKMRTQLINTEVCFAVECTLSPPTWRPLSSGAVGSPATMWMKSKFHFYRFGAHQLPSDHMAAKPPKAQHYT